MHRLTVFFDILNDTLDRVLATFELGFEIHESDIFFHHFLADGEHDGFAIAVFDRARFLERVEVVAISLTPALVAGIQTITNLQDDRQQLQELLVRLQKFKALENLGLGLQDQLYLLVEFLLEEPKFQSEFEFLLSSQGYEIHLIFLPFLLWIFSGFS